MPLFKIVDEKYHDYDNSPGGYWEEDYSWIVDCKRSVLEKRVELANKAIVANAIADYEHELKEYKSSLETASDMLDKLRSMSADVSICIAVADAVRVKENKVRNLEGRIGDYESRINHLKMFPNDPYLGYIRLIRNQYSIEDVVINTLDEINLPGETND